MFSKETNRDTEKNAKYILREICNMKPYPFSAKAEQNGTSVVSMENKARYALPGTILPDLSGPASSSIYSAS